MLGRTEGWEPSFRHFIYADSGDFRHKSASPQVDIAGFVWYIRALRAKGLAFRQPLALPEFKSDQLKEDAACRFSFAITMSIKPSRR